MKTLADAHRRWNGPVPQDVREQIFHATHPPQGSRRATVDAWACVRHHAKRANDARRRHDHLDLYWSEHWLNAALNTWRECRADEKAEAGRLHFGTRAYTEEAWRVVKFHARDALHAKRRHDLLARHHAEVWLSRALDTWERARNAEREELATRRTAE